MNPRFHPHLTHRLLLFFSLGLLALLGGCAGRGTVDMCTDVRNDSGNVLRNHSFPQ